MADVQKSRGNCVFCGQSYDKAGMTRHLKSCSKRNQKISEKDSKSTERISIFHLLIQDAYDGDYWLHLEMSGEARLKELDKYLRAIWLECCGHLSQFFFKKWEQKIPMNARADAVFEPGLEIFHVYDFGTSSETKVKVVAERAGVFQTNKPIFLMARNDPPDYFCQECGEKGKWLCIECLHNNNDGALCDKHAESHPHDNYGEPVEIVNSPRVGMCGYDGPADAPY